MPNPATGRASEPAATLSVLEGVAIIVAVVIGIGIFKTPSLVAANVDSEVAFIGVWVAGGLITLVGALTYAELGSAYPSAGGEYHFLSRAFGRSAGLFFAWARGAVIQTGAIAALAFVYGDYAQTLLPLGDHGAAVHAVLGVLAFTGVNILGTQPSKRTQTLFFLFLLLALAAIVVVGFNADPAPAPAVAAPESADGAAAIGMAMVLVLLTYGGWNEAAYLSGEIRDVKRTMVRVLMIGVLLIMLAYGLVNMAYLYSMGLDGLRASDAVAADLMRLAIGETGAIVLSLIVCIAALSSLNGTILTGGRAYYAIGRDVPQLRFLGAWDGRGKTPTNGLLTQAGIALALILFGAVTRDGFQAMVDYTAPVFWFFMLLVSLALFVLRRKDPDRERPFKVPFYPVLPAIFSLTCLGLLYSSLVYTGAGALIGVAMLLAGVPLLLLERQSRGRRKFSEAD
ncbi:APC family permease [Oceanibaculum pacificum]|uniref:Amino acid permease n=1 Tax=Oceanibaculum pacificum TaxID=580166 RepID=A0A154WGD1_9PROT|nr:amino acid permease [Oceanibaculum pacificum]KZD12584.1 amino acid permease [Oceanibaculum pacificum]